MIINNLNIRTFIKNYKQRIIYDNHGCSSGTEYTCDLYIDHLIFHISYNNFGSFRLNSPNVYEIKAVITSVPTNLINNFNQAVQYVIEHDKDVQQFIHSYLIKNNNEYFCQRLMNDLLNT